MVRNPFSSIIDSGYLAKNIMTLFTELLKNNELQDLLTNITTRINENETLNIPEAIDKKTFGTFSENYINNPSFSEYEKNLCISYNIVACLYNILNNYNYGTLVKYYSDFTLDKIAKSKAPSIKELLININHIVEILDESKTTITLGEIKLSIHDNDTNGFVKDLIQAIDPLTRSLIDLIHSKNSKGKYEYSELRKLITDMKAKEIEQALEVELSKDYDENENSDSKIAALEEIIVKFIALYQQTLEQKTSAFDSTLDLKQLLTSTNTINISEITEKIAVSLAPIDSTQSLNELEKQYDSLQLLMKELDEKQQSIVDFQAKVSTINIPSDDSFFEHDKAQWHQLIKEINRCISVLNEAKKKLITHIQESDAAIKNKKLLNASKRKKQLELLSAELLMNNTKINTIHKELDSMSSQTEQLLTKKTKLLNAIQAYQDNPHPQSSAEFQQSLQTLSDEQTAITNTIELLQSNLNDDNLLMAIKTALQYKIGKQEILESKKEQLNNQKKYWSSWTWGKVRAWTVGNKSFSDHLILLLSKRINTLNKKIKDETSRKEAAKQKENTLIQYQNQLVEVEQQLSRLQEQKEIKETEDNQLKQITNHIQKQLLTLNSQSEPTHTKQESQTIVVRKTQKQKPSFTHELLFTHRLQKLFPFQDANFISLAKQLIRIPTINDHTQTDSLSTFRKKIIKHREEITRHIHETPIESSSSTDPELIEPIEMINYYENFKAIDIQPLSAREKRQRVKQLIYSFTGDEVSIPTRLKIVIANDNLCRYLPLLKDKHIREHLSENDYQQIISILNHNITRNNKHIDTLKNKKSRIVTGKKYRPIINTTAAHLTFRKAFKKRLTIRKYRITNKYMRATGIKLIKQNLPSFSQFVDVDTDFETKPMTEKPARSQKKASKNYINNSMIRTA